MKRFLIWLCQLFHVAPPVDEIRVIWPMPQQTSWNPGMQSALKEFLNTETGQQLLRHFEHWEVYQAGKSADTRASETREWLAGKANGIRMGRSMMIYLATPQENPVVDYDEKVLDQILEERVRRRSHADDDFILGQE